MPIVERNRGGFSMVEFLWLGSALGVLLGLTHGVYLYRRIAARAPAPPSTHEVTLIPLFTPSVKNDMISSVLR